MSGVHNMRTLIFGHTWTTKANEQADLGLHSLLTESVDVTECMNGEQRPRWCFTHVRNDRNLCILCMYEGTFLLDMAHTLTHSRLNKLSNTIYWYSPFSILGMSGYIMYIFLKKNDWAIWRQWRPWADAAFCSIWSGSALIASYPCRGLQYSMD